MAKIRTKVEVNALSIDKVQTMVDLLNKHKDELPSAVVDALTLLADDEAFEYDSDWFSSRGIGGLSVYCDGSELSGVVSVNRVLKRLTLANGRYHYFDRCNITSYGKSIMQIGE